MWQFLAEILDIPEEQRGGLRKLDKPPCTPLKRKCYSSRAHAGTSVFPHFCLVEKEVGLMSMYQFTCDQLQQNWFMCLVKGAGKN